jgi:hypothetical protein
VKAVSVWDRKPSPHDVLEKRLAMGWEPTPSEHQDGPVVEGYAACVYKPAPR